MLVSPRKRAALEELERALRAGSNGSSGRPFPTLPHEPEKSKELPHAAPAPVQLPHASEPAAQLPRDGATIGKPGDEEC